MTNEEIIDREYTQIKECIDTIATEEVKELVERLEMAIRGKYMIQEIKGLRGDYRTAKEGI